MVAALGREVNMQLKLNREGHSGAPGSSSGQSSGTLPGDPGTMVATVEQQVASMATTLRSQLEATFCSQDLLRATEVTFPTVPL